MVRSYWIGPVVVALAVTGFALSQTAPKAVETKEHTLTVQEANEPSLKCKVLKSWRFSTAIKRSSSRRVHRRVYHHRRNYRSVRRDQGGQHEDLSLGQE